MSHVNEPEMTFPRARFPIVTVLLLVGNMVGFVIELNHQANLADFLNRYSFVPAQTMAYVEGMPGTSLTRSVLPFFCTLFFHTGFLHLVINMLYLWLIGDVMEVFLGRVRLLVLWLAGGLVWGGVGLATISTEAASLPCLGCGGCVAVLLGAYLGTYRQLLRVSRQASRRRLLMIGTPIAVLALGWFPLQLLSGSTPLARSVHTEFGPPWWGIGASFALGVLLVQFLLPPAPTHAEAVALPTPPTPSEPAEAGVAGTCCNTTLSATEAPPAR